MFGGKNKNPISESLKKTRPVRYDTRPRPTFRRTQSAVFGSARAGFKKDAFAERFATEAANATSSPRPSTDLETIADIPDGSGGNSQPDSSEIEGREPGRDSDLAAQIDEDPGREERADALGTLERLTGFKERILKRILDLIDLEAASKLSREELAQEFGPITTVVLKEMKITLNRREQLHLEGSLIDELMGYGPLEVLLKDPTVADILVNGPDEVFVERHGRLEETDVKFRSNEHILQVANRIVSRVGRRVNQSTPMCDARLEDGSRVNVVVPPLMPKSPAISIRKFSPKPLTLDIMVKQGNLSQQMAVFLKAAAASRLNIIVSGGTGSGKTTMLNALSRLIDHRERIITIEDAAELQLQQKHVLTMETRPANLEGEGEVTIRDLTINALRMRPDRIILGEVRGPECIDMLQAMNTGHEGSMCTLHANRPREALTRMENMAVMSGINYPISAIRTQIVEAIDVIIQVSRMRDGMRRVVSITEVVGMEGEIVVTQELFRYKFLSDDSAGMMTGVFEYMGLRPACHEKLREFGFDRAVMDALQ